MLNKETLITLFEGNLKGLTFNFGLLPADKLGWKPAPQAKSALEIADHLAAFINEVCGSLSGEKQPFQPATSGEEAQANLTASGARFTQSLRAASDAKLGEIFSPEYGISNEFIATGVVVDVIHHGGQISYLQTLLGDEQDHFDSSMMAELAQQWKIAE